MAHVWLQNPETGGLWQCPKDVVAVAVARGWVPCDEPVDTESHLRDPEVPAVRASTPDRNKAARRGPSTPTTTEEQ